MPNPRAEFTDFSGGLVLSRSPATLQPNELRVLENYIIGPKGELMTRPPLLRAASNAMPNEVYHINVIKGEQDEGDPWGLLIGDEGSGGDYFAFDNTATLAGLTDQVSSASYDPYPNLGSFRYKGIFYVFGDGVSNAFTQIFLRCDTTPVLDGGDFSFDSWPVDTPGAPTVAAAAGGALPAATWRCVVTFYNNRTGAESPAGTVSAAVTTAGPNLQIAWTGIPVASGAGNSQVTYRRLWRTLPNQTNEYYLVGTLADNSTTVFTDNVAVASMGARVSTDAGLVIGTSGGPAMWRERQWMPASSTSVPGFTNSVVGVAYSKPGLPETFAADAFLPVGADDVSNTLACAGGDDYLIAFKSMSLWRITGTGPSNFRVDRIKAPTGLSDAFAYAVGPLGVFFLGSDGYFYLTDGYSAVNISEKLGKLDLHTGQGATAGISGTQIQSIVWPGKNWFMTVVYEPSESNQPLGSLSTIYVYDYVKNAWMTWPFSGAVAPTRPRPRCLNLGYDFTKRAPRMYVGGQTDTLAFITYFDDDLFQHDDNRTDLLLDFTDAIVETPSSPRRVIRTKDFDASDFGFNPGSAFIVKQVLVRVEWPTSIESNVSPDGNWQLEFAFTLLGNTNTDVSTSPDQIGGIATTTVDWSAEDRANGQWHAVGLSSQQQATTSIGLEILSAEGNAPRRHSITGVAFEVVPVHREFIQAGEMLVSNITGSISGTVTGGANGTAYLCPTDPLVASQSETITVGNQYSFTGLPAGEYTVIVTDQANANSATDTVTLALGEDLVLDFAALDVPSGSDGCP